MKSFILAAIAVMSLGLSVANAATQDPQAHRPNYYNWLAGGGGYFTLYPILKANPILNAGAEPVFCRSWTNEAPFPPLSQAGSSPLHGPCDAQY
jgi:hypothetical protein